MQFELVCIVSMCRLIAHAREIQMWPDVPEDQIGILGPDVFPARSGGAQLIKGFKDHLLQVGIRLDFLVFIQILLSGTTFLNRHEIQL